MDLIPTMMDALLIIMDPGRLLYLFVGVLAGVFIGLVPGLGGPTGLAIMMPFALYMDPYAAIAMMIGVGASTNTSDTLAAVLFAIPGSASSQATILDGHPMARRGEAGRALGAAYTASLIGGLIGAVILSGTIQIARPVVMAFGSPELFMLGLLGISMTASLVGGAPIKGIVSGALGLLIGMVGLDVLTGSLRWTYGALYLYDGIPVTLVALGVFAVPEIIDLMIKGTRIAEHSVQYTGGVLQGMRDVFRHWFLVLRTSILGIGVGAVPGLGGPVVDWFAYGHALQTEKGAKETFGKGDIRGVIGIDAATNAKEGGALMPTLLFGVPGSTTMALLIAVFLMHGINPGPEMVGKHMDMTLTVVWSLALANVFATGICLLFVPQTAKIVLLPIHSMAPVILVMIVFAAYQASASFGDLIALFLFSVLGWLMKRFGWPRPPLVLGLVLSPILERYLYISVTRYGAAWLARPIVIIAMVLVIISLAIGGREMLRKSARAGRAG